MSDTIDPLASLIFLIQSLLLFCDCLGHSLLVTKHFLFKSIPNGLLLRDWKFFFPRKNLLTKVCLAFVWWKSVSYLLSPKHLFFVWGVIVIFGVCCEIQRLKWFHCIFNILHIFKQIRRSSLFRKLWNQYN